MNKLRNNDLQVSFKDFEVAHPLSGSLSNWNLEMLVFEERRKPVYPEKLLGAKERNQKQLKPHITRRLRDFNPSHVAP